MFTNVEEQDDKTYLQLFALQDVAIGTTGLPRSARDGSIQTTSGELRLKERVDLSLCNNLGFRERPR